MILGRHFRRQLYHRKRGRYKGLPRREKVERRIDKELDSCQVYHLQSIIWFYWHGTQRERNIGKKRAHGLLLVPYRKNDSKQTLS